MMSPFDDFDGLLHRARAGSREALGQILEACRVYLYMIAGAKRDLALQAKADASDLVQETFLEAQRDFSQFNGVSEEELLAWMRQLLLNNMANFTRSYRGAAKRSVDREIRLDSDNAAVHLTENVAGSDLSPSGMILAQEQAQKLQCALERLPDDYRHVLLLRYQEQRAFEEIAGQMNRSANAVRKLWMRAVERLQDEMREAP
jgi:RNA polymerase sigma-70 factor, ECF subfamily